MMYFEQEPRNYNLDSLTTEVFPIEIVSQAVINKLFLIQVRPTTPVAQFKAALYNRDITSSFTSLSIIGDNDSLAHPSCFRFSEVLESTDGGIYYLNTHGHRGGFPFCGEPKENKLKQRLMYLVISNESNFPIELSCALGYWQGL